MHDLGKTTALNGETAQVSIQPHGGCESCEMKSACKPEENVHLLWALNSIGGRIGDEVEVELRPQIKVFGSLVVFIFPLIGLFIGLLVGTQIGSENVYGVVGALIGLVLFFFVVRFIDKSIGGRRGLKPVITRIL